MSAAVDETVAGPVVVTTETDGRDWDAFVERHALGTVEHLWGWRSVYTEAFKHDCVYIAARREGRVVGVLPMVRYRSALFGKFVVSLPYFNYAGVVADDPGACRALVDAASALADAHKAGHLELRHRERQLSDLPYRQTKIGFARPLPGVVDDLWKSIDRKVRNQVRKAQKEGLTVARGGAALIDEFYGVFAENMRDLGTPVFPEALFRRAAAHFPERFHVFLVRHGHRPVAGGVALTFRDTILVPWASSLRSARQLCPNMLLYWSMMEWGVEKGFATFDFGRSSAGAGTQQFKEQWGGVGQPLFTEYVLLRRDSVPEQGADSSRMQRAVELWQRLPISVAGALGPRIIRHVA
jgi:serine/alanine adding enzyme